MKKVLVFIISYFLLTSISLAGSCPILMKKVDEKLATSKLSAEALKSVKDLRTKGEAAHKAGDHPGSEKLLNEALKKLG